MGTSAGRAPPVGTPPDESSRALARRAATVPARFPAGPPRTPAVRAAGPMTTAALAADAAAALPRPEGWIGTVNDWARALGIGFALLDLAILLGAWILLRRAGLTPAVRAALFVGTTVLPLSVTFFGYQYGLDAARRVDACGACHVMASHVRDLRDPASQTLAAVHFKNRYIQADQCYTCHTDYGMFGSVRAKWEGLMHTVRYATGAYTLPIRIAHPYSNVRCLFCHGESQKFLRSESHPAEIRAPLAADAISCLDCHGPAHPRTAAAAAR